MSTIRVDRIEPYQSGNVTIESVSIPNLASTGSNTFDGDQNILGTLTASLQEGYTWVGGTGNVSTLAATSSFGGGSSTDITALNSFTRSADIVLGNLETFTSSQENLNLTFATTASNIFLGNQEINGDVSILSGEFNVTTGSGQLTSSLSFTHNVTSPGDGNATLELRHNNDLYNDDVALQLKTDFAGAYVLYEENGIPYSVLSVQSLANKNIYIQRDTRLFQKSLTIDNDLTVTGSLLSSGSANFLGDVTASVISGSFVGDGSGLQNLPAVDVFPYTGNAVISGSLTVSGSISQTGIGENNTIIGSGSGENTLTDGSSIWNTFIGAAAGQSNIAGGDNTYIGAEAGKNSISTIGNTFVGAAAGINNTSGELNSFFGSSAGYNNGIGSSNTFIGHSAGNFNISGSDNTLVGKYAGSSNTIGHRNTSIGTEAAVYATSGGDNLMLGYRAGAQQISGANITNSNSSVFLGSSTRGVNNASNQIVIGALAQGQGSNTTVIGNSNTTATYLKGKLILSGSVAQELTGSLNVSGSMNVEGSVNVDGSGYIILLQLSASQEYADDSAAAAGGVPLGGLYRDGGNVRIRIS